MIGLQDLSHIAQKDKMVPTVDHEGYNLYSVQRDAKETPGVLQLVNSMLNTCYEFSTGLSTKPSKSSIQL